MIGLKVEKARIRKRSGTAKVAPGAAQRTVALRIAEDMGLLAGPKTN